MLKFLQYRSEVEQFIVDVSKLSELQDFRVGFTGSFATSENKDSSPIDIVLKLKDGADKKKIGSLDIVYYLNAYMHDTYSNKVKVIWFDLLQENEKSVKEYQANDGIEGNPESPYLSIVESLVWADTLVSADDDEDETEAEAEVDESNESVELEENENNDEGIKVFHNVDAEDDSAYAPDEDEEDE